MRLLYILLYSILLSSSAFANWYLADDTRDEYPYTHTSTGLSSCDGNEFETEGDGTKAHMAIQIYCNLRDDNLYDEELEYHWYLQSDSCPDGQIVSSFAGQDDICIVPLECQDNEFLNDNNECEVAVYPDSFPDDNATSHGTSLLKFLNVPEDNCNELAINNPDGFNSTSRWHIFGWNSSTNKCLVYQFNCDGGLLYDSINNVCSPNPDALVLNPDENPDSPANACEGGVLLVNYMAHLDFCNDNCSLQIPSWSPPLGYDTFNLLCGHKYIEYRCPTDYRLKEFKEVACTVAPDDYEHVNIDMDDLQTNTTNDTNVSALAPIDADAEALKTTSELSTISQQQQLTNDKLDNIKDSINDFKNTTYDNSVNSNSNSQLMGVLNGASSGLTDIASSFGNLKNVLDGGFNSSSMSSGTQPTFETEVFHKTLKINLCDTFSKFHDIAYWVFYLSFMYVGIRIFIFSFLIGF